MSSLWIREVLYSIRAYNGHTATLFYKVLAVSKSNRYLLLHVFHIHVMLVKKKWSRKRTMPKCVNGRGFPRVKRSCGVVNGELVGRINVSSGTSNPVTYNRLHSMLDDLVERGDSKTLVRIRDNGKNGPGWNAQVRDKAHHQEILEVLRSWRTGRDIESISGWRPLTETLNEWIEVAETRTSGPLAERTRKSYRNNIRQLLKFAAEESSEPSTDADLPALVSGYRVWCSEREYWVPFNQALTMCQSYARQVGRDGTDNALYKAVRRISGLSTKRKRERENLTVREVRDLMQKLPNREAQHVWNMCCLATRPDEYGKGQWEVKHHAEYGTYVQINGTKNGNAVRVVPLVEGVSRAPFADSTFRRCLRKAVGSNYLPRDFRSTGKRWRIEAGIDPSRCRQYFGHSMAGIADRYDTGGLLNHVAPDAARLNEYIQRMISGTSSL